METSLYHALCVCEMKSNSPRRTTLLSSSIQKKGFYWFLIKEILWDEMQITASSPYFQVCPNAFNTCSLEVKQRFCKGPGDV